MALVCTLYVKQAANGRADERFFFLFNNVGLLTTLLKEKAKQTNKNILRERQRRRWREKTCSNKRTLYV